MRRLIAIFVVIFSMAIPSLAQESPDEVNVVLQTLSAALGVQVTPDVIDDVSWREVTFTSTALGCPNPAQIYDPLNATGYQIFVVYEGVTYDYRVTTGGELVLLCSTQDTTLVVPEQPTVIQVTPTAIVNNNVCTNALMPRLAVGEVARTTPELGSNIRSLPDLNAEDIGTIPPSTEFVVIGGPECGPQGNYWWQVEYNGLQGWTYQGQDGLYFVEPIPQPLPATTDTINSLSATELLPLGEIESNLLGIATWSADGQMIAIADASTANAAIWLYFVNNLSQVPVLVEVSFDTTALEFSPDGSLLAIGDPNGNVYLLEINTYSILHSFVAHDTAVLDIDFSPDGRYMLVMDDNYTARFYGVVSQ